LKQPAAAKRTRLVLAAVALLVLSSSLVACGSGSAHPSGKNQIVLQMTTGGGFVPIEFFVALVPEFSLYGDGRVIGPGSVPAIYPGPALPNLQTTVIPEKSVQAILAAAREAGLFNGTFDYGQPRVADAPTTTIVINAGGATYRSQIYALTVQPTGGLSAVQQRVRAAVSALRDRLVPLTSFTSGEIVWESYQFTALAVFSQAVDPGSPPDPTGVQPNLLDWPLGDLATLGQEASRPGLRRVVLSGQDLAALRPLLDQATQITLWKSGGKEYHLFLRPLLPDETA
jgi:hypothetical protein